MFNLTEFLFYAFTKTICFVKLERLNDEILRNGELDFKASWIISFSDKYDDKAHF